MIETLTTAQWLQRDAGAPAPTFFARPAWALALACAQPFLQPYPVRFRDRDGRDLLVPLVRSSGGALRWREAAGMPMGGYTCAMHDDGTLASADEFARAIGELGRAHDALRLTPWPLASIGVPHGFTTRTHDTAIVDLRDGADAALARFDGVVRRMAGQAVRRGVTCQPCDSGASGIETYYEILSAASARWGLAKPPFPKRLLEGLVTAGGRDVEIWFARANGEAIAGAVVFYGGREAFVWSAAMLDAHARLRPSNALNAAMIAAAAGRGMQWYNLGASEGLAGVERFKRGLGASIVSYPELLRERVAFAVYSRVRKTLRRTHRRVPA